MLNNTLIATKLALFRITFTKEIASSVKWTDWNIMKTYILVWYDYPKLDGLTMGDKQQDKMWTGRVFIHILQTVYSNITIICKLFSHDSKPRHALLASKRRLIDLQKVPF